MKTKFLLLVLLGLAYAYGIVSVKRDVFPYSQITNFHNQALTGGLIEDGQWNRLDDDDFLIAGLPSYAGEGTYYRLPAAVRNATRNELKYLSEFPSGGRMIFRTNAEKIKIDASVDGYRTYSHMTAIMQYGFDIYVDDRYVNSIAPSETGTFSKVVKLGDTSDKEVTLYFPLYSKLERLDVSIPKESQARKAQLQQKQMVFYGSSITQGCCASNPAMAFPAIVTRAMNYDLVNLGFMGNGLGDPDIARYIGKLQAPVLIFDFWANPTPEQYAEALPKFYREVRSLDQNSLIFVLAPFSTPGRELVQEKKYASSKRFVEQARQAGDQKVIFIEGLLTEHEHDGFVDARHLNSYGNKLVAERLIRALSASLGVQVAEPETFGAATP